MPDLKRLKDEIENGVSFVRTTRTKLAITGQYHDGQHEGVVFLRKRNGFEMKWHGHVRVDAQETQRCDMGHQHRVVKNKHWVWNYSELSPGDVRRIVEFLSGGI